MSSSMVEQETQISNLVDTLVSANAQNQIVQIGSNIRCVREGMEALIKQGLLRRLVACKLDLTQCPR
jgi:hypothetical protein